MAKVNPYSLPSSSSCSSSSMVLEGGVFTIWMKSLVMSGNGCTIFDSQGKIAYRVDNYEYKCRDEVYLMDPNGRTLVKIVRKKLSLFGRWEGSRCHDETEEQKPWFRVQKTCQIFRAGHAKEIRVVVSLGSSNPIGYKIVSSELKSEYRILDIAGGLLAEVKQKHTSSGVVLGNDVKVLVVEDNVDHLLIMGLVVVFGLINHRM